MAVGQQRSSLCWATSPDLFVIFFGFHVWVTSQIECNTLRPSCELHIVELGSVGVRPTILPPEKVIVLLPFSSCTAGRRCWNTGPPWTCCWSGWRRSNTQGHLEGAAFGKFTQACLDFSLKEEEEDQFLKVSAQDWKAIKCYLWTYFQAWFFQVLSKHTALAFASSCGLKWTVINS